MKIISIGSSISIIWSDRFHILDKFAKLQGHNLRKSMNINYLFFRGVKFHKLYMVSFLFIQEILIVISKISYFKLYNGQSLS